MSACTAPDTTIALTATTTIICLLHFLLSVAHYGRYYCLFITITTVYY